MKGYPPRKRRPGARALDCHGAVLHFDSAVRGYGPALVAMARDVELLVLGMVEVEYDDGYGHICYLPSMGNDPYYLYKDWAIRRPW